MSTKVMSKKRKQELEEYILFYIHRFLIFLSFIIFITSAIVLYNGERRINELESQYPSVDISKYNRTSSVKKEFDLYIANFEVPKELLQQDQIEKIHEVVDEEDTEIIDEVSEVYYQPTDEERQYAYLLAFAEAGIEDSLGQTLVINVAINHMKDKGYSNLIEEFTAKGRYSSVIDGVPCIKVKDENGECCWKPVTEENLTDELKAAVDVAFQKDYTEEMLREVADELGKDSSYYEGGALYFYCSDPRALSPEALASREGIEVKFEYGRHIFYRIW